jgi:sodium transport system permease protein
MNLRPLRLVYRKELRELLRDRRTIMSMLIVPGLIMPMFMTAFGLAAVKFTGKARQDTIKVMLLGGQDSPATTAALRALPNFAFVPPSPDFTNLISTKTLSAAIQIPAGFDAAVQAGDPATVTLYTYSGEFKSMNAAGTLDHFFRDRRDHIVSQRLTARQVPQSVLTPFDIRQTNVASPQKVSGNLVGMILPYLLIMMCLGGSIYPAVDMTAGEKERGTMETLLCSPVSRTHLVLGKCLVVLTAALVTSGLSTCSYGVAVLLLKKLTGGAGGSLPLTLDPSSLIAILILVLPLAIFFSATMLAVGLFARSAKEANSYLQPLLIIAIMPAAASVLPGVELNWKLALVPVLNVSLAGRELMAGLFHWPVLILVLASMTLYAALAVTVAVTLFKRESILFRT